MEAIFRNLKIKSKFMGDKEDWKDTSIYVVNKNRHVISVRNIETKRAIQFEFWGNIMHPKIETEKELIQAFKCFVYDALDGEHSFSIFCKNNGCKEDDKKSRRTYNAHRRSYNKLIKIYQCDIHDLYEQLKTKY